MDDSSINSVQKNTIVFIGWFFVLALILSVVGGALLLLYKNSGYTEYRAALSHISSMTDPDKANTDMRFFGNWDGVNSAGGILAASWKYGIWVWEKPGLTYFSVDQNTRLLAIYGCIKTNLMQHQNNVKLAFNSKVFSNTSDWRTQVKSGDFVAFKTTSGNRLDSISAYPEFKTTVTPWVFCNVILPAQSAATK